MKYSVQWLPKALSDLGWAYLLARHRGLADQATRSSHEAEQQLSNDPYALSESRDGLSRIMFAPPLTIYFSVDDSRRKVFIEQVRFHSISKS